MSFPVIPAINTFADVKSALQNIRAYFIGLQNQSSSSTGMNAKEIKIFNNISLSGNVGITANSNYRYLMVILGSISYYIDAPNIPGREFVVVNGDVANPVTIKVAGQPGVTVAAGKRATVFCNGTDYVRVTDDQ